jgi:hypothetical protein
MNGMKKSSPTSVLFVFILVFAYFVFLSFFPIDFEVNHTDTESFAHIHRKSMIPPFKDIDITVNNLKQAIITTSKGSKGKTNYRVELESFNGERTPVMPYYSSSYFSKRKLQDQINSSLSTKTPFKIIIKQSSMSFSGSIFFFATIILIFYVIKHGNKQKNIPSAKQPQRSPTPQYPRPQPPKSTTEEEKYKNINDSIIK